jgi:hypothetical protein
MKENPNLSRSFPDRISLDVQYEMVDHDGLVCRLFLGVELQLFLAKTYGHSNWYVRDARTLNTIYNWNPSQLSWDRVVAES